jgi:trehalose 6-phosphate synthase
VLILSQFAGAAEEMTEALIVNPYNIEETAEALRSALEMDLRERRARHGALLQGVYKNDAVAWSRLFIEHLQRTRFSASHEIA